METKTNSKVPLTIEEMRDMRFLIATMRKHLPCETKALSQEIEWALYALDHAIENPNDDDKLAVGWNGETARRRVGGTFGS